VFGGSSSCVPTSDFLLPLWRSLYDEVMAEIQ
jgi:hypothetical protein